MKPVLSRSTMVGGDHMFLFAMRVPVCTRSWQIINNFPLTLKKKKKLVHWTTNYTGNKSSNRWPPCLKLHWLLLRSCSTCWKCFLITSKYWHRARFQLTSSAPLCSLLLPPPISFWCPSALVSPREHNIPPPLHPLTWLSPSSSVHPLKPDPVCVCWFSILSTMLWIKIRTRIFLVTHSYIHAVSLSIIIYQIFFYKYLLK